MLQVYYKPDEKTICFKSNVRARNPFHAYHAAKLLQWEPRCLDDLGGSRLENSNAYAISVWAAWSFNQYGGEEEEKDEKEGVL